MTKISQLSSIGDSLAIGDQFLIRDIDDATTPNKSVTVSGIARALPDGSATTPALAFASDKNTGIYRAGTDSLAVATNGTGRLFVDSVGNVGTNVTPFAYAANARNFQVNGTGYAALTFGTTDGGTGEKYWRWIARTASPAKTLVLQTLDDSGGGEVNAYTLARNGTAIDYHAWSAGGSERLRITSAGLVGIGTSTPGSQLDVVSPSNSTALRTLVGSTVYYVVYNNSNGAIVDFNDSTGTLKNRIDARAGFSSFITAGNLGIGTTSPGDLLHLNGGDFRISANSSQYHKIAYSSNNFLFTANAGQASVSPSFIFSSSTSSGPITERARIDGSGRLLVGTASSFRSDSLVQIDKASGNNALSLRSSLADGQSTIVWTEANGRSGQLGIYKHAGITNNCAYLNLQQENAVNPYFWTDNSGDFRVSTTATHIGTASGTVVGTQTSDERLKNILGPVEYGLEIVKQLEPVRYALKTNPDTEKLGFIAQQVLPLVPQSVFDTDEEIEEGAPTKLGMEYVSLIPVLVNAIKELSAEVDALKAQLS